MRNRVAKYLVPVLVFSVMFNVTKFFESAIEYETDDAAAAAASVVTAAATSEFSSLTTLTTLTTPASVTLSEPDGHNVTDYAQDAFNVSSSLSRNRRLSMLVHN
jgi:hypothetical protein